MANEARAYLPIKLLSVVLAVAACANAEPLHPDRNDGAALGQGGGAGGQAGDVQEAGAPLEAGVGAGGASDDAGSTDPASDAAVEAAEPAPADAGGDAPAAS